MSFTQCGNDLDLKQHELQWFLSYGRAKYHFLVSILEQNEKVELMYRPPGRESHINITEALDEIFHRLNSIETTLSKLEKTD